MTQHAPSPFSIWLSRIAVTLCITMLALGTYWYGFSIEVQKRFWTDIFERMHGPMTFRFYLQPTMALIAAVPDGIRDARQGHTSFFWSALLYPSQHPGRLREGLHSVARVILLGISMDAIYQFKVLSQFYPAEAAVMAILLALIPYFVFRWIVEFVARWWFASERGTRQ